MMLMVHLVVRLNEEFEIKLENIFFKIGQMYLKNEGTFQYAHWSNSDF